MITRLIPLFVSSFLTIFASVFLLKGLASTDRVALVTTQELVSAGAAHVQARLQADSRAMVGVIPALVDETLLGVDLRALSATVNLVPPSGVITDRLKTRKDAQQDKLRDRLAAWHDSHPAIGGLCLVDEAGIVMLSDTPMFNEGDSVPILVEEPQGTKDGENPKNVDTKKVPPPSAVFELDLSNNGIVQTYTQVTDAGVFWITASPIYQKTRLAGALIIVSPLRLLAATPGAQATLIARGKTLLGSASDFDIGRNRAAKGSALLRPTKPSGGIGPLFVAPDRIGVWGREFSVPNTEAAHGFVTADLTSFYAELGSLQTMTTAAMALLWLAHLGLFLFGGSRLGSQLGWGVNRPVRASGDGVAPLPVSPSLDEVLEAQHVEVDEKSDIQREENDASAFAAPTKEVEMDESVIGVDPDSLSTQETFETDTEDLEPFSLDPGSPLPAELDYPELPDADLPTTDSSAQPFSADEADGIKSAQALLADADAVLGNALDTPANAALSFDAEHADPFSADNAALADDEAVLADDDFLESNSDVTADGDVQEADGDVVEDMDSFAPFAGVDATSPASPPVEQNLGDMLDEFASDATAMMQLTPELMAAMKKTAEAPEKPLEPPPEPDQAPVPADSAANAATAGVNGDSHFQEVFEQFIKVRQECGESITDLTFDKFAAKLIKSREAVMGKHGCSDVHFQVYVKHGKAALKAVPAR